MKITRENYEAYFLDYFEGSLTDGQVEELMAFLVQNPNLTEEFHAFEMLGLDAGEAICFPAKDDLKKPEEVADEPAHARNRLDVDLVTDESFEYFCIAFVEGSLDEMQAQQLEDYLQFHPEKRHTLVLFEKTRLYPDLDIRFVNKDRLIRPQMHLSLEDSENMSFTDRCIAWYEGDLSAPQARELMDEIARDALLKKSFELIGRLRLESDRSIVFPHKSVLKRYAAGSTLSPVWSYFSAAAVVFIMAGLFFMLPRQANYSGIAVLDTPSSWIPPAAQTADQTVTLPEESLQDEAMETTENDVTGNIKNLRPRMAMEVIAAPARQIPESRNNLMALKPRTHIELTAANPSSDIEKREDFRYWLQSDMAYLPEESTTQYTTLGELAKTGLKRTTGLDLEKVDRSLATNTFSLWDVAGAGLAGVGQLTGTNLALEKERDDQGRVTLLSIGDRFQISRRK